MPKCQECGKNMKPHSMFFDESYNEHYYRKTTVDAFHEKCDVLIVVGTALQTTYANNMVVLALDREVPVIEVNMEPCVLVGHTFHVIGKAEEMLPRIFEPITGPIAAKQAPKKQVPAGLEESKQAPKKPEPSGKAQPTKKPANQPAAKKVTTNPAVKPNGAKPNSTVKVNKPSPVNKPK